MDGVGRSGLLGRRRAGECGVVWCLGYFASVLWLVVGKSYDLKEERTSDVESTTAFKESCRILLFIRVTGRLQKRRNRLERVNDRRDLSASQECPGPVPD